MLSKFSLVFINTTASSKVVNHASTVNVFSSKNSQFELPQNFISQIDRGSIALSLEYHFTNGRDNTDLEGNFEKILKNQL